MQRTLKTLKNWLCCAFILLSVNITPISAKNLNTDQINKIIKSLTPLRGSDITTFEVISDETENCFYASLSRSYNLPDLLFKFDSFSLTTNAKKTLELVAVALNSKQLRGHRYLIAGFTDTTGPFAYNLGLSEKRASSVLNFLVNEGGVSVTRLASAGFGETNLRDANTPTSEVNRRVTVMLAASEQLQCDIHKD